MLNMDTISTRKNRGIYRQPRCHSRTLQVSDPLDEGQARESVTVRDTLSKDIAVFYGLTLAVFLVILMASLLVEVL